MPQRREDYNGLRKDAEIHHVVFNIHTTYIIYSWLAKGEWENNKVRLKSQTLSQCACVTRKASGLQKDEEIHHIFSRCKRCVSALLTLVGEGDEEEWEDHDVEKKARAGRGKIRKYY